MFWWQRLEHKECLTVEMACEWALGTGRMSAGREEEKGYSRRGQSMNKAGRGEGGGVLEEECDPGEAEVPAVEQDATWDFGYQQFPTAIPSPS